MVKANSPMFSGKLSHLMNSHEASGWAILLDGEDAPIERVVGEAHPWARGKPMKS
jgi:hypothetical protein